MFLKINSLSFCIVETFGGQPSRQCTYVLNQARTEEITETEQKRGMERKTG